MVFLDHDDMWDPEMLETVVGALDAHPEHVAAHAIATCIDEHGNQYVDDDLETFMRHRSGMHEGQLRPLAPSEPTTFAEFAYLNWIVTPGTLVIRRAVASAVGGFDGEVTPADDWDMAVRVSRHGDVGYVDRTLLRWRRHADALSYASPGYGRAHLMVRHKMLIDRTNTPAQLARPVRDTRTRHARDPRRGAPCAGRSALARISSPERQGPVAVRLVPARSEATRWWLARFETVPRG